MYSTVDPGAYTGNGNEVMSPLSIGGGGPHFPLESKKKYLFDLLKDQRKTGWNKTTKNIAQFAISRPVIPAERNDSLKKFYFILFF